MTDDQRAEMIRYLRSQARKYGGLGTGRFELCEAYQIAASRAGLP